LGKEITQDICLRKLNKGPPIQQKLNIILQTVPILLKYVGFKTITTLWYELFTKLRTVTILSQIGKVLEELIA
jgi:hypothetical protein